MMSESEAMFTDSSIGPLLSPKPSIFHCDIKPRTRLGPAAASAAAVEDAFFRAQKRAFQFQA